MNFIDNGIVLDSRALGETHAIVDIFTSEKGRWAGLVYGVALDEMNRRSWRMLRQIVPCKLVVE